MTDGPSIQLEHVPDTQSATPIDLTNYAAWIEIQPLSTLAGILDVSANELYRRELFAAGNDIKHVVSELRA